jgi:UPF0716 protein FxsA
MRLLLLFMFVAFPLLELVLLIRAGQALGLWPVLALIFGTGILGLVILRRQGFKVAQKISAELEAGRTPVEPLADSGLIFAAGALLISPGLIADTLGLLLLVPALRKLIRRSLAAALLGSSTVIVRRSSGRYEGRGPNADPGGPPIIEGDWKRVDDDTRNPR